MPLSCAESGNDSMAEDMSQLAQELAEIPPAELHDRLRVVVERLSLEERFDLLHRRAVYHHPDSVSGAAAKLAGPGTLRHALPPLAETRADRSVLHTAFGADQCTQHAAP